jgi:alpha-tubulin suppressor-like RCC1 family protein
VPTPVPFVRPIGSIGLGLTVAVEFPAGPRLRLDVSSTGLAEGMREQAMTGRTSRASSVGTAGSVVAAVLLAAVAAGSGLADGAAASAATAGAATRAATGNLLAGSPRRTGAATAVAPLRSWGYNRRGQLGDGSEQNADLPVEVKLPRGIKITAVRAGCSDSLALASDGRVYAWGDNSYGQLGDGTTNARTIPVRVELPKGVTVTAIRAGCFDNLALTAGGRVYAWGENSFGELGDGTNQNRHRPVLVRLPVGTRIRAISAGCGHNLAMTSGRRLLAWGSNQYGQLGNGTASNSVVPTRVKLPAGVTARIVSAGCYHSIAMTSAGLFGWGLNTSGQLGNGTTVSSAVPVAIKFVRRGPPIGRPVSLFAGCYHTLVLFSKGAVLAWGDNTYGQLGNGSTTSSDTPVSVHLSAGAHVRAISAACYESYAVTAAGQVLAWGYNGEGELGDGLLADADLPVIVRLPAGLTATAAASGPGAAHAFAIVRRS